MGGGGGRYLVSRVVACLNVISLYLRVQETRKPGPYVEFESFYSDVQ